MTPPVPGRRPVRVVTVRAYWIPLVLVTVALGPVFGGWVSIKMADQNARQLVAEQRRSEAATRAESRRLACSFFALNLDVYDETPPTTPVGRNLRQTYLEFYRLSGCQPPRK